MKMFKIKRRRRILVFLKQITASMFVSVSLMLLISIGVSGFAYGFTPGEGGHITDVAPFTAAPNKIGGLSVTKNDRYPYSFSSGTYAVVDMSFPLPSTYGATSVTLQYSTNGVAWSNYQHNGADTTTDYNNFSIQPDGDYQYRLLVNGGLKDGYTSNIVTAARSAIDTRFGGWGLDQSMWISGVMMPWVGRGLTASFTVNKIEDGSVIVGHLDYQWYRVNPATYEMIPIAGATDLTYITTIDDVGGYYLFCRATGDNTEVGGYAQVGSSTGTVIPNLAYASNVTRAGFTLNLQKSIDSLPPETLKLTYYDPVTFESIEIDVTGVTKIDDAIYSLAAEIPSTVTSLYLQNSSDTWRIAQAEGEEPYHMLMEGLSIDVPTQSSTILLFLPAIIK